MFSSRAVTVFGAYGHTGRFVVSQLRKRGWTPILSGRDADKLNASAAEHPGSEVRVASVDNPQSLDRAISGAGAIINCAGPFLDTAVPIIEAAIRWGIHYLDVAAEQAVVLDVFERFADVARVAGVVIERCLSDISLEQPGKVIGRRPASRTNRNKLTRSARWRRKYLWARAICER
jgi:short subunit dehydrogenase-like uncharacterized protein